MLLEDDTILKPLKKIVLNKEEQEKYDVSYRYFMKNKDKFFYFYNSSFIGFLFKKKRELFLNKTSYFNSVSNHNALYRAYQMAELIAEEKYSINALSHYKFLIDGKEEVFGVFEIHPCIFHTAKILKTKMEKQKREKMSSVVVNLKTDFQEKKIEINNIEIPDNVIKFK